MSINSSRLDHTLDNRRLTRNLMGCGKSTTAAAREPAPPTQLVSRPAGPVVFHYFNCYLRGEVIRMLLAHLNITYTDDRINPPDWRNLKMSGVYEFQQLPMLEIDGRRLVQKACILRYICQKNNLYPARTNYKDIYFVESICDLMNDITNPLYSLLFAKDFAGLETHYNEKVPAFLQSLEKRLVRNNGGKGFLVGNGITMADIQGFSVLWDLFLRPEVKGKREGLLSANLKAYANRILAASPNLKNYVQTRVGSPV